jgi:hypothetical protein
VFADALGGPIHPQRLTEWFGGHRKAAGIPTGSLHVLRHTAATLALTSGVPVHIVAARLGDEPKQILTTYAHLLPQSDELAAERMSVCRSSSRKYLSPASRTPGRVSPRRLYSLNRLIRLVAFLPIVASRFLSSSS